MACLRTLVIALTIRCWNNAYLLLPSANSCHLLKAIHNTTKYESYLSWSFRQIINISPGSNEYLCFETRIIVGRDPARNHFLTLIFLSVEILPLKDR